MRNRIKTTRKKAKYQQSLRIESLETRNLLTGLLSIQPVEHIIDPVVPPVDTSIHHAPLGTSAVVDVASGTPYSLSVADFGFSDPNDTPADSFTDVLIDTLPASGNLWIGGTAVTAGQYISVVDIEAGKLQFMPPEGSSTSAHPRMTFQVVDSAKTTMESRNADPVPKTLVFSLGPNVAPVAQDDAYSIKEGETLNQVRAVNQLDLATRVSDNPASSTAHSYDDFEYSFTANRLNQNGVIFRLSKPYAAISHEVGPQLMFAAAHNERFAVGTYENAHGWPSEDPESPVLTVTADLYSGGDYSGRFTVHQVEYGESGDIILFDASFEVYFTSPFIEEMGNGPIIYSGRIQYNIPIPESVSLLQNDVDADSDPLVIVLVAGPQHGTLKLNNEGGFRYVPDPGFNGVDTFQYKAWDGIAESDVTTVTLNVVLPLSTTIHKAVDQTSYTTDSTIHFSVVFSQPVVDFSADDVTLSGTGPGTFTATITPVGTDGTTYDAAVTGMTGSGRVFASIAAGKVHNARGDANEASHNPDAYVDYFSQSTTISGTTGNDVIEFFAAPSSAAWIVKVNSRTQAIPADLSKIVINGISGNDKFLFYGSTSPVTGILRYEEGNITFGEYTLAYVNMDDVTVNGASGDDRAILDGTSGNDTFEGLSGSAHLTGNGKAISINGVENVIIASMGGEDSAVMYASRGGSGYLAEPLGVSFSGTGFNYQVMGFKTVSAYAVPGEDNHAVFKSIRDNDLLIASYLGAQYLGDGFAYDVWNLSRIEGHGELGDEARFYGSPNGNTTLTLTPATAIQTEKNLTLQATGYTKFASYVYPTGNTSATITGTSGNERLASSPAGVQLFGTNVDLSAWTYKNITVVGGGGEDAANMYTAGQTGAFSAAGATATLTTGAIARTANGFSQVTVHGNAASTATFHAQAGQTNTFNAAPTEASMSGTGYLNTAKGFGTSTGFGVAGGTDVVNYADSTDDDYFISSYKGSQMFGEGFNNSAWSFATTTTTSTGGSDIARFYGSPNSADSFVGAASESRHSGQGFASTAKNFARVESYSNANARGTAQLTGSSNNDFFVGSPVGAQLWNQDYRVEAWGYASVKTEGNGGSDLAYLFGKTTDNGLTADNVFAQFSGDGFSNRVDHFATVRVTGSAAGRDTAALDHAYLETGIKEQPTAEPGRTINQKLWLYDFDQATVTEKPVKVTPEAAAIDKFMTAFMYE